jgi:hypothetical protein
MTAMSKPKPGDEISYNTCGVERTGIVLDAAPIYREPDFWEERRGLTQVPVPGYAYWVHREDGTFDKVKVFASGKRAGETAWLGHYTAGGVQLDTEAVA